jgi:hypothetical protein
MPYYPAPGPHYPAPGPRAGRSSGRPAPHPHGRPRISPSSPAYYLGTPVHVWVAAMSRKSGREQ